MEIVKDNQNHITKLVLCMRLIRKSRLEMDKGLEVVRIMKMEMACLRGTILLHPE